MSDRSLNCFMGFRTDVVVGQIVLGWLDRSRRVADYELDDDV